MHFKEVCHTASQKNTQNVMLTTNVASIALYNKNDV